MCPAGGSGSARLAARASSQLPHPVPYVAAGRHADSDDAGLPVRSDVGTIRFEQSYGRATRCARCMALRAIGTRSGAAHVIPPAAAASYGRTAHHRAQLLHRRMGHGQRALIDGALEKPLYAAGNMPAAR